MAIGDIHLEIPSGAIDGSNVTFKTSAPMNPLIVNVWLNGVLIRRNDDDGFTISGVDTFDMNEAPVIGDTIHVRYEEA